MATIKDFKAGDKVFHKKHGGGTVRGINETKTHVVVDFDSGFVGQYSDKTLPTNELTKYQ